MDPVNSIKTLVTDPSVALMKANKVWGRTFVGEVNPKGIDVFAEDWDNLIILDACRRDALEETIGLDGSFESRISRGTSTLHFLQSNFQDRSLRDTVYVTSNGWIVQRYDEINADLFRVKSLDSDETRQSGGAVVSPDAVTEEAKINADQYPDKRLIVHYTQPHKPYLGEFGRKTFGSTHDNLQQIMSSSSISEEDLKRAYMENLELVLEQVEELVDHLDGKTVVTADHGELLGERVSPIPIKGYGHPSYVYHPALTEIPWFVCEYDSRREIREGVPEGVSEVDKDRITEQLKDLGYVV
jgi:hypothetical protein